jgi:hypothetical protein
MLTYDVPEHLDENVREEKSLPHVGFGLPLSRFIQSSLYHEIRHDLVDELKNNEQEHEDGKHLLDIRHPF